MACWQPGSYPSTFSIAPGTDARQVFRNGEHQSPRIGTGEQVSMNQAIASALYLWPSVHQENSSMLPSFLVKVARDQPTRTFFRTLAIHAVERQKKREKLQIEAISRLGKQVDRPVGTLGANVTSVQCLVRLDISPPEWIRTIRLGHRPANSPDKFETVKRFKASSSYNTLSLDFEFNCTLNGVIGPDITVHVELQPYVHWSPPSQSSKWLDQVLRLQWPKCVEFTPKGPVMGTMSWEMDIYPSSPLDTVHLVPTLVKPETERDANPHVQAQRPALSPPPVEDQASDSKRSSGFREKLGMQRH